MSLSGIAKLIGNTPLIRLDNYIEKHALKAEVYAKLEYFNPTGSVKDRTALYMLKAAFSAGKLKKGGLVVEPTSGNTGVSVAALSSVFGFKAVIVMPENMSGERIKLIKAYGAEIILTPADKGMKGAVAEAERLAKLSGGCILGQFENPANPAAHFETTGAEIWRDSGGKTDIFIAGVGTGGTLSGAGAYLKSKNPDVKVIAVEPADSPLFTKGRAGAHGIQGIGAGFVPATFDLNICDGVTAVEYDRALAACREIAQTDGLFVGISSGAALCAAAETAARAENAGKTVAVIFPDSGDRYLSII